MKGTHLMIDDAEHTARFKSMRKYIVHTLTNHTAMTGYCRCVGKAPRRLEEESWSTEIVKYDESGLACHCRRHKARSGRVIP